MKLQLKKRWKVMKAALHMELREHKSSFIVYMTLRILVILMMILQFFNKNYENVFLCILTLLLLIVPDQSEDRASNSIGNYNFDLYICGRNSGRDSIVLY